MKFDKKIQDHTVLLHKLSYEKIKLLERIEKIGEEMIHYEAVINSFILANSEDASSDQKNHGDNILKQKPAKHNRKP